MTAPNDKPHDSQPGPAPKAQHFAEKRDWPGYFKVVLGKPPRETLLSALDRFEQEWGGPAASTFAEELLPFAIDLGCGEGRDTLELLRRGWKVRAIDAHPAAFDMLLPRAPTESRHRLTAQVAAFEELELPAALLVNASFSLPFCDPAAFDRLWQAIARAILPGGRFAGQLFGDRDSWAAIPARSHQTEEQARALFDGFTLEEFRIDEKDDNDAGGNPKHWHVFHIVAKRRPEP